MFYLIRRVAGKNIVVKLAAENVASMSKPACQQISKILRQTLRLINDALCGLSLCSLD